MSNIYKKTRRIKMKEKKPLKIKFKTAIVLIIIGAIILTILEQMYMHQLMGMEIYFS